MKCPICGEPLRPGKKDPSYLLCYTCRKKYKAPGTKNEEEKKYSNIPPKSVREKREKEMKRAYDDMLAAEEPKRRKKSRSGENTKAGSRRRDEFDEIEGYQEEKVSKAPIVILAIAILVVAGIIAYMLLV